MFVLTLANIQTKKQWPSKSVIQGWLTHDSLSSILPAACVRAVSVIYGIKGYKMSLIISTESARESIFKINAQKTRISMWSAYQELRKTRGDPLPPPPATA
jgi:hypothetical protein